MTALPRLSNKLRTSNNRKPEKQPFQPETLCLTSVETLIHFQIAQLSTGYPARRNPRQHKHLRGALEAIPYNLLAAANGFRIAPPSAE
jgi:hypothetical protein